MIKNQQKHLKDEIFILRRININENDSLIFAFGKYLGKITLKAKGSKKLNSRFSGQLEPLSLLKAEIYNSGKSLTLTTSQILKPAPLNSNFHNLQLSQKICKFLNSNLAEEDPNFHIFKLLDLSNELLRHPEVFPNFDLYFLSKFLEINGLLGNIKNCINCQSKLESNVYLDHNFHFTCPNCLNPQEHHILLNLDSLKVINFLKSDPNFQQSHKLKIPPAVYQESLNILCTIAGTKF